MNQSSNRLPDILKNLYRSKKWQNWRTVCEDYFRRTNNIDPVDLMDCVLVNDLEEERLDLLIWFLHRGCIKSTIMLHQFLDKFQNNSNKLQVYYLLCESTSILPNFCLVSFTNENIKEQVFLNLYQKGFITFHNLIPCLSNFYDEDKKLEIVQKIDLRILKAVDETSIQLFVQRFSNNRQIKEYLLPHFPFLRFLPTSSGPPDVATSHHTSDQTDRNTAYSFLNNHPLFQQTLTSLGNYYSTTSTVFHQPTSPSVRPVNTTPSPFLPFSSFPTIPTLRPTSSFIPPSNIEPQHSVAPPTTQSIRGLPTTDDFNQDENVPENSNTPDNSVCCVCLSKFRKVLFIDCKHLVTCISCAVEIGNGTKKCPVCRRLITQMCITISA